MLRKLFTSVSVIATTFLLNSCGKPNTPPPVTPTNKCFLVTESVNGGPGYGATWTYQYDADGHLLKGTSPQNGGGVLSVNGNMIGIGFNKLVFAYSYAGDLKGGTPSSGSMDFTDDGVGYPKYEGYIFGYDGKKRITSVAINAGTVNIKYDDNDNVIQMSFIANNGPRVISPIVTVEGYDDKPSPYAADPRIWIFTQQMRSWSYFNEYRIISALSKNNPGKITTDYGADDPGSKTVDNILYQYGDNNMPTAASVQRTYKGATTGYQSNTYGYDCK